VTEAGIKDTKDASVIVSFSKKFIVKISQVTNFQGNRDAMFLNFEWAVMPGLFAGKSIAREFFLKLGPLTV